MSALKSTLDRFRGCLVGALIGDCLGASFKGDCFSMGIAKEKINPQICVIKQKGSKQYTDGTEMTKSVCSSLLRCGKFESVDMANRFTQKYFRDTNKGYGRGIREVFHAWGRSGLNYQSVYGPSSNLFDGSGSYGNGGAIRVAPVALFTSSIEDCIVLAKESARLTHNHPSGYNGAILQSLCVYKSLYAEGKIKWMEFLEELKEEMSKVEEVLPSRNDTVRKCNDEDDDLDEEEKLFEWTRSNSFSYTKQLDTVKELLTEHYENKHENEVDNVIKHIGRDISAQQAVPAALYCFLRNLELGIEETLYYAISLGGDNDTIGTMCLAMAGAYYGYSTIPESWKNVCDSHDEMKLFAEKFYTLRANPKLTRKGGYMLCAS